MEKTGCVRCGGEGEYEATCQECYGDGCPFCEWEGTVWLPCYGCPIEAGSDDDPTALWTVNSD